MGKSTRKGLKIRAKISKSATSKGANTRSGLGSTISIIIYSNTTK